MLRLTCLDDGHIMRSPQRHRAAHARLSTPLGLSETLTIKRPNTHVRVGGEAMKAKTAFVLVDYGSLPKIILTLALILGLRSSVVMAQSTQVSTPGTIPEI